jgi:hypothetical protein
MAFPAKGLKITLQQAAVPPLAGFPIRNFNQSIIRSLTPQQAVDHALAIAGQAESVEIKICQNKNVLLLANIL